jgi:predicted transcriptional regulator
MQIMISLAENTGITEQTIRTCLNRLKSTNEITIKVTNKYSIITICNYESYQLINNITNQQINQQPNQQLTINQPTTNQQLTTNKNEENNKNKKNIRKELDFVDENFKIPFESWLNYKKHRNETYKTDESLQACYRNLLKLSNNDPQIAIQIIEQSFAQNYSGLFPLKINGNGHTNQTNSRSVKASNSDWGM